MRFVVKLPTLPLPLVYAYEAEARCRISKNEPMAARSDRRYKHRHGSVRWQSPNRVIFRLRTAGHLEVGPFLGLLWAFEPV